MASVFAIVSRAIFDRDFPRAKIGDVLEMDRYVSKHPNFDQMQDGDAIFLFTVRPKDQPWLVGILERPKKKKGAWIGRPNSTAVTDIRPLMRALRFSTGKGIGPSTGGFAMTLQTPRRLTDNDVMLLRGERTPDEDDEAVDPPTQRPIPIVTKPKRTPKKKR